MNSTAALQETIKARALKALRADKLPDEKWALKNRIGVTVCKINVDLFNESFAKKTVQPSLNKTQSEEVQRAILKELTKPNIGTPLR
jgi:hypothetical protein